jgi:hypothetical protein
VRLPNPPTRAHISSVLDLPLTQASHPPAAPCPHTVQETPKSGRTHTESHFRTTTAWLKTCPSHTSGIRPGGSQVSKFSCTDPLQQQPKPQSIRITSPDAPQHLLHHVTMHVSRRFANAEQSVGCDVHRHAPLSKHSPLAKPSKRICGRGACLMRNARAEIVI